MRNSVKRRTAAAAAILATTVGVGIAAEAVMAAPASAAGDACPAGTYYYNRSLGSLSNGILYGGMCLASGSSADVRRVNVGYSKSSGSGVSVRLGWELVNGNASINGGSWWSSTINMSAGQTREVAFTYSGGVYKRGTTPCFRSKMKDMISGQQYWGERSPADGPSRCWLAPEQSGADQQPAPDRDARQPSDGVGEHVRG